MQAAIANASCVRGIQPPQFLVGSWHAANTSFGVWPHSGFRHERGLTSNDQHYCVDTIATAFTCNVVGVNASTLPQPLQPFLPPPSPSPTLVPALVATERFEVWTPVAPQPTATCRFAMDSHVDAVLYNGRNLTASVEGDLSDWEEAKSISFDVVPGASLVVLGRSDADPHVAGLWLACRSAADPFWGGAVSSLAWNNHWAWRATEIPPWSPGAEPVPPEAWTDPAGWAHPVAHRDWGYVCPSCGNSSEGNAPTRVWLPNVRHTAFAVVPPPAAQPVHAPFLPIGCRYYTRPQGRALLVREFRIAAGSLYEVAGGGAPMDLYSDDDGTIEAAGMHGAAAFNQSRSIVRDAPFGRAGSDDLQANWWRPFVNVTLDCPATVDEALAVDASSPLPYRWMAYCGRGGVWCGEYVASCDDDDDGCGELACTAGDETIDGVSLRDDVSSGEGAAGYSDEVARYGARGAAFNATCSPWPRLLVHPVANSTARPVFDDPTVDSAPQAAANHYNPLAWPRGPVAGLTCPAPRLAYVPHYDIGAPAPSPPYVIRQMSLGTLTTSA